MEQTVISSGAAMAEASNHVTRGRAQTIPEVPDEGLLVQTLYSGILPKWHQVSAGTPGTDYEICGKVLFVGRSVGSDCPIKEGDTVVIYPWIGCSQCEICSSGNSHLCEDELLTTGEDPTNHNEVMTSSMMTSSGYRIVTDWRNAVRLPKEIPGDIGCLLPYGALKVYTGLLEVRPLFEHAVRLRGFCNLLVISGAGDGAEIWVIILMKNVFCEKNVKVICADFHEKRLETATRAGADDAVLWSQDSSVEDLVETTTMSAYNKMDVAIDLVGNSKSFAVGFLSLHHGGTLLELGMNKDDIDLDLPLSVMMSRSLTVKAIKAGSRTMLSQLVDLVSVLGELLKLLPVECFKDVERGSVLGKLEKNELASRAIIEYE